MLAFDVAAAATPAAPPPITYVLCARDRQGGPDDLYVTRDGHDTRQVLRGTDLIDVATGGGTTLVSALEGFASNGLARLTLGAAGLDVTEPLPLPPDPDFEGLVAISPDGRKVAWSDRADDGHGGLVDRGVVAPIDGRSRPRTAAVVHSIADMDFDERGRLHVLAQVAGHGSRIVTRGARDVHLRERTYAIRYGRAGRLALSGPGFAEVRDRRGRVLVRRGDVFVQDWSLDGSSVLVLRARDLRLASWNVRTNRLRLWRSRVCALPVAAVQ